MFACCVLGFEAASSALLTTLMFGVFSLYCVAGCAKKKKDESADLSEIKIAFDLAKCDDNNSLNFVKTEIAFPKCVEFRNARSGATPKASKAVAKQTADDQKSTKETKESKDTKVQSKESKDTKVESKETKDTKVDSKETKDTKVDSKETKDTKAESKETKTSEEQKK